MSIVHYIGYSIDAVIEAAREKVNHPENEVVLHATGRLGSPLDSYNDMISERYADIINTMLGGVIEFRLYKDPRYLYIPYKLLKVANRSNGVFHFPLNELSFSDKEEYAEMKRAYSEHNLGDVISDTTLTPSKLISAVCDAMPESFGATFKRALGITRWRGLQLARLAIHGYRYEYPIEQFCGNDSEYFCLPDRSYEKICMMIAAKYGIHVEKCSSHDATKLIMSRDSGRVVVMDNRVDMYMNFMCGKFDRAAITMKEVRIPSQIKFGSDGLYYTPLSTCWGVMVLDDRAYRLDTEMVQALTDLPISELPSTRGNMKTYDTYQGMIRLYGDKTIDLGQRVETMIK